MTRFNELFPLLIIALAVIIAIVRRSRVRPQLRRGELTAPEPDGTASGGTASRPLLLLPGDTGLVAARELRERLRTRGFRVGTLFILVVVAAAIVIPALLGSKPDVQRVGVVGGMPAQLRAAVVADGRAAGTSVRLVAEPTRQVAATGLRGGRIDLAVIGGQQVLLDKAIAPDASSVTGQLARAVAKTVGTAGAMQAAGVTATQAGMIAAARPLPVASLQPGEPAGTQRNTSFAGLVLVFIMLTQYNVWTLTGVMGEKSSRVAEVLLAAIRPAQLLTGKVLGIGLAAFAQAGLVVAFAFSLAKGVHSDLLHGTTPLVIGATLVWLVLGYAFYSWIYAAAGAMTERQDQVQSLSFPLGLPVIAGYLVAFNAAVSGSPSLLLHVFGYLPLTAPLVMPVLVSLGAVTWWQFAIAAVLSVACTVGVARAAVSVYRRAVLLTGRRVRLREVLPITAAR
jgi:ABC-2 type transport system permease protein